MNELTFTGAEIYAQIKRLEDEDRELRQALEEIEKGTLPHRLLIKAREEKHRELNQAKNAEYTA